MIDPVVSSDKLDEHPEMKGLYKNVADLAAYGRRSRRLIRWVIALAIFEVIIIIALGAAFFQLQMNQEDIKKNTTSILASCESGNNFRASQITLWDYILAIPPQTPPSPEQDKRIADFKDFVHKTFSPRDCSVIK